MEVEEGGTGSNGQRPFLFKRAKGLGKCWAWVKDWAWGFISFGLSGFWIKRV